jgi:hypothetical protein
MITTEEKAEPRTEFELHFAAQKDGFAPSLSADVYQLGFWDNRLVGGGAVVEPGGEPIDVPYLHSQVGLHVTWDGHDVAEYRQKKRDLKVLLERYAGACTGFAQGEAIRRDWDIDVDYRPFNAAFRYPLKRFDMASSSRPKTWDIHISADRQRLDPGLEHVLVRLAGMYFIDLEKTGGRICRVFTVQGTSQAGQGHRLFACLRDYLRLAGGMQGSIKFEQKCFWAVYGQPDIIPPVIESFEVRGKGC